MYFIELLGRRRYRIIRLSYITYKYYTNISECKSEKGSAGVRLVGSEKGPTS
jgi:hypothetical protein